MTTMTIKKLIEQLIGEQFENDDTRELALKLARSTGKKEIKSILTEFVGDDE